MREDYDRRRIPPKGLLLLGAADVQANAIYVEILAFAPDRQSWVIEALVLDGDTSDPERGAFAKLAEVFETPWPDSFNGQRRVDAFGIDSGFRANVVYNWVRGRPNTFALKGLDGWSRPALSTPSLVDIDVAGKHIKNGARVWAVGTWALKAHFYADLRKKRLSEGAEIEPPGTCHFGRFLDQLYFQQITSEYLADELFRGRSRKIWKERGPNHWLDCRVYNLALADYLGLSRMTETEWAKLEELRCPKAPAPNAPKPQPPQQPQRRSTRSSFMD